MISVIVTSYGKSDKMLTKCLKSTLDQGGDYLIETITIENGNGASAARNEGMAKAKGKYLFFLDADCVLMPDILTEMRDILENYKQYDFVYGDYERTGVRDSHWAKKDHVAGLFNPERLAKYNYISPMSLIRKNKAPQWDENIKRCCDWDYWLTAVFQKGCIGYYLAKNIVTAHFSKKDLSIKGWKDYAYWFQKVAQKHNEMLGHNRKV